MPVLINENDPVNGNPWGIKFMTMFHMSNDSHLFHTREELEADGWTLNGNVFERAIEDSLSLSLSLSAAEPRIERMIPLYEAKMLHLYDTHWATYEPDGASRLLTEQEKAARVSAQPRYWVAETEIDKKLGGRWEESWFLGWRDVCRSTDVRTVITTQVPRLAYGHKWMLCLPGQGRVELQSTWSSFAFDYVARQKLGGTSMTYSTMMQLPMPRPEQFKSAALPLGRPLSSWLGVRVDRLNAWIADEPERARVRAELDAAAFLLYGLDRHAVSYVMDTFPIVKRKDEATFGSFRTKELILAAYDAMTEATASGRVYQAPWNQEVAG